MSVQLVPFGGITDYLLSQPLPVALPGQAQGVYITLHPDVVDDLSQKMVAWFADRPEVQIVDVGTSDKQQLGFLLIEWLECEIDPLFLAILREEEMVGDYTVYGRRREG